jgi:hypothetical protein
VFDGQVLTVETNAGFGKRWEWLPLPIPALDESVVSGVSPVKRKKDALATTR